MLVTNIELVPGKKSPAICWSKCADLFETLRTIEAESNLTDRVERMQALAQ